jgi:hypothetical protein
MAAPAGSLSSFVLINCDALRYGVASESAPADSGLMARPNATGINAAIITAAAEGETLFIASGIERLMLVKQFEEKTFFCL